MGWTTPPYPVEMVFRPDGVYSARSLVGGNCTALCMGTDADSPLKTYAILGLDQHGRGWGDITIVNPDSTTTGGELREITLNSSLTAVSFKFFIEAHAGGLGPIVYNLACIAD